MSDYGLRIDSIIYSVMNNFIPAFFGDYDVIQAIIAVFINISLGMTLLAAQLFVPLPQEVASLNDHNYVPLFIVNSKSKEGVCAVQL
jgi:hypothetical protein